MMNKYEKAFEHLREHASFDTVDEMIDIKELVERATPQKLLYNGEYVSFCNCPNCKKVVPIHGNYCPRCEQALDWREKNNVD